MSDSFCFLLYPHSDSYIFSLNVFRSNVIRCVIYKCSKENKWEVFSLFLTVFLFPTFFRCLLIGAVTKASVLSYMFYLIPLKLRKVEKKSETMCDKPLFYNLKWLQRNAITFFPQTYFMNLLFPPISACPTELQKPHFKAMVVLRRNRDAKRQTEVQDETRKLHCMFDSYQTGQCLPPPSQSHRNLVLL